MSPKHTSTSKSADSLVIWTVGHSNRTRETFLELLKEHSIKVLADVRSFPTSKIEHFKRDQMKHWLLQHGIEYVWLGHELGGYRRGGYKKHMRTKLFKEGIEKLLEIAVQRRTCVMCMESDPSYCHRRYISARLEQVGMKVRHILVKGQMSLLKV